MDRDTRKTTTVKLGARLQVGATSATIIHIASHTVYVKVNSRIRKWKLGKSFAEVIDPIPDPAEPERGNTGEADAQVTLRTGESIRIPMPTNIPKLLIENTAIVTVKPVSATDLRVTGRTAGSTTMTVWDEDENETPYRIVVVR
jgi:Flp pilus assembly secretin CpaC